MEKIWYEKFKSPVGVLTLVESEKGLMRLDFENHEVIDPLLKTREYVVAGNKLKTQDIITQLEEYFEGKRKEFDIKLDIRGASEFYLNEWNELLKIPYGETRSYKQMAQALGNKKACRAVGNANGKNPIAVIIPCHRVINTGGGLGGFGGGLKAKRILLALEGHKEFKEK